MPQVKGQMVASNSQFVEVSVALLWLQGRVGWQMHITEEKELREQQAGHPPPSQMEQRLLHPG